ncbi:hypothetical protein Scep_007708 [Stephania cephalantha]|uniref:Major facilitator superfamily (MFS) profile domain-containing protein n=1 Tax=Stephania cephalantha TaxID=152367 RepID=A0AAP0KAF1_9MAGN
MANIEEPMLKKVYYRDCPGCRMDQRKETRRGIPYKEFTYVWVVTLCNALPMSTLFPYLYFMIRDVHIAKREEDIGYYAGFVGSSYMFGRALTSVFWGIMADKFGRKPIIMIGTASIILFNTLFGLSTSFWMAISTRFLLGAMNPLLALMKAYATEVSREEHQSLGLSLTSTAWGIGLIIGPALGGWLAQPAEKFPDFFPEGSLFWRFPYLLPCVCTSIFAVIVFISCFWLPETLHMHDENCSDKYSLHRPLKASPDCCTVKECIKDDNGTQLNSEESLLRNWPLMSAVIAYCVFSLHDMAYSEIFSLWAVSPRKYGGLNYSTNVLGEVLTLSGIGLFIFQTFFYPVVEKRLGPLLVSRMAAALSILVLSSYPFIALLSGFSLFLSLNCASMVKNVLCISIVTGLFILQNNAVPQHQRGAANGIAMAGMSLFNGFGPAMGGMLFSLGEKQQNVSFLPGVQLVFFALCVIEFVGLLMTFKPILVEPVRSTE